MKHHDRRDALDSGAATRKLEKQLKELRQKLAVVENTLTKKNQEAESLRAKIEKRHQEDERWIIRDKASFEKHFGRPPSQKQGDDKYMALMRMYESQREKLERLVEGQDREIDRLNKANLELENQNFAL